MTLLDNAIFIAQGIIITLQYTSGALLIGFTLGILLAIARYQGRCQFVIDSFVSIIRGTPMILQLSFFYFALPSLLNIRIDIFTAGLITFGLNSAAYLSEIFRAGIESIPKGQFEAAKSLRIPSFYIWRDIIIPQVLKNVFPAIMNETITLVKETALVSVLGELDIMRRAQTVAAQQFDYFVPICIAGACYYILVFSIEKLGKTIERRWQYA